MQILLDRFSISKKISNGCFGTVYEAFDKLNDKTIALKIQNAKFQRYSTVKKQQQILEKLKDIKGVPEIYFYGFQQKKAIIAIELLGKDFGLIKKQQGKFSPKTLIMMAISLLHTIEKVHSRNIIHQDIKPQNIVIGGNKNQNQLYFIDFGISKCLDKKSNRRINFVGTPRYASIVAHKNECQSKKDDLQSLGYVFIFFCKDKLPWMNIKCSAQQRNKKILQLKEISKLQQVCSGAPKCFLQYLRTVRSYQPFCQPNYDMLRKYFYDELKNMNQTYDKSYDWARKKSKVTFVDNSYKNNKKNSLCVPSLNEELLQQIDLSIQVQIPLSLVSLTSNSDNNDWFIEQQQQFLKLQRIMDELQQRGVKPKFFHSSHRIIQQN